VILLTSGSTSPSPYCVEYIYPGNSLGYGCGPSAGYTKTVALTVAANSGAGSLTGVGTSASSSSSSSSVSSSQVPSSSTSPSPSSSAKLGGGAIAGIAVGSVAGFGLLVIIVWFIWRKRWQTQAQGLGSVREPVRDSETTYAPKTFGSSPPRFSAPRFDHSMQQQPHTGPTMPELSGG
jgi:hypothetical protein